MYNTIAKSLNLEAWRIKGAIKRGTIKIRTDFTPPYAVFLKKMGWVEEGTVVFLGENPQVIRGYPKIKRALFLSSAIKRHFKNNVAVEEKMNGYNVRVFSIDNKIVTLTRGGFICPYTASRIKKIESVVKFAKKERDLVLCGEVVGIENPYVVHCYEEACNFGYFVFDVRYKGSNTPLSIKDKMEILDEYGVPRVNFFGIFPKEEAVKKTFEILREMEIKGREGVVLKDPEMKISPIKYTPSLTNISDLKYAFRFPYDFGRDFFFSRVIREGFQAVEMEENEEELRERARRIGESILFPMVDTIKKIKEGNAVTDDYRVRVNTEKELKELFAYLQRQGVRCTLGKKIKQNSEIIVEIKKIKSNSNDKIRFILHEGVVE